MIVTLFLLPTVVLLILVVVLALRLRRARQRARWAVRRLAQATGHPSAGGRSHRGGWLDRRALADAAAHHLAGMGMVTERRAQAPIATAKGRAGDYVLTVLAEDVLVEYVTTDGRLLIGEFPGINGAVREIAAHADLPAPV